MLRNINYNMYQFIQGNNLSTPSILLYTILLAIKREMQGKRRSIFKKCIKFEEA